MKKHTLSIGFDSFAQLVEIAAILEKNGFDADTVETTSEGNVKAKAKTEKVAETAPDAKEEKTTSKAPQATKELSLDDEYAEGNFDAKLALVQKEITKHTKKGKSADIKKLLAVVDAKKASEIEKVRDMDTLWGLVRRYSNGESIDAIVGDDDGDLT